MQPPPRRRPSPALYSHRVRTPELSGMPLDRLCVARHAYWVLEAYPMAEGQQDKRSTRRFALRLPVSVTYTDDGDQMKSAQTRDVSARGISFYVDAPIAKDSPIEFTLTLPPEITLTESIKVRCK